MHGHRISVQPRGSKGTPLKHGAGMTPTPLKLSAAHCTCCRDAKPAVASPPWHSAGCTALDTALPKNSSGADTPSAVKQAESCLQTALCSGAATNQRSPYFAQQSPLKASAAALHHLAKARPLVEQVAQQEPGRAVEAVRARRRRGRREGPHPREPGLQRKHAQCQQAGPTNSYFCTQLRQLPRSL